MELIIVSPFAPKFLLRHHRAMFKINPCFWQVTSTWLRMSSGGKDSVSLDDQVIYCPAGIFSSVVISSSTLERTVLADLISSSVFSRLVPTSRENFHWPPSCQL